MKSEKREKKELRTKTEWQYLNRIVYLLLSWRYKSLNKDFLTKLRSQSAYWWACQILPQPVTHPHYTPIKGKILASKAWRVLKPRNNQTHTVATHANHAFSTPQKSRGYSTKQRRVNDGENNHLGWIAPLNELWTYWGFSFQIASYRQVFAVCQPKSPIVCSH